jgi:hypothetical protein
MLPDINDHSRRNMEVTKILLLADQLQEKKPARRDQFNEEDQFHEGDENERPVETRHSAGPPPKQQEQHKQTARRGRPYKRGRGRGGSGGGGAGAGGDDPGKGSEDNGSNHSSPEQSSDEDEDEDEDEEEEEEEKEDSEVAETGGDDDDEDDDSEEEQFPRAKIKIRGKGASTRGKKRSSSSFELRAKPKAKARLALNEEESCIEVSGVSGAADNMEDTTTKTLADTILDGRRDITDSPNKKKKKVQAKTKVLRVTSGVQDPKNTTRVQTPPREHRAISCEVYAGDSTQQRQILDAAAKEDSERIAYEEYLRQVIYGQFLKNGLTPLLCRWKLYLE